MLAEWSPIFSTCLTKVKLTKNIEHIGCCSGLLVQSNREKSKFVLTNQYIGPLLSHLVW